MAKKRSTKKQSINGSFGKGAKPSAQTRDSETLPSDRETSVQDESSPKRVRLSKSSSAAKAIRTPDQSRRRKSASTNSDCASPTSATAVRTSQRARASVNYDMHYHPAGKRFDLQGTILEQFGLMIMSDRQSP